MTTNRTGHSGPRTHIVVIGSIAMDLKWFDSGEYHFSGHNGKIWQIERYAGGVGRNVAANLARLGVHVTFAALSGTDREAEELEQQLSELGVAVAPHRVAGRVGTVELVLDGAGTLTATTLRLADPEESLPLRCAATEHAIATADGVMVETGLHPQLLRWVQAQASQTGAPVCAMPTRTAERPLSLASLSGYDALVLNEKEAARIVGEPHGGTATAARHAQLLAGSRERTVVVTCGASGAVLFDPGSRRIPRVPSTATSCLDDTGAGDALAAAFFAGLVRGGDPTAALRHGMRAAGITVRCRKATCARLGSAHPDIAV